ncbi:MAG: lipid-A-disaccharide synthase [Candidatus Omnitrophica bacterium]|nr:lipid-A-disaccharide synthase [Candidatus Omnitrophota bacterium]
MAQKQILIVCGEPSGELHAAGLSRAIRKINPDIKISAVGGNLLRQAGAEIFYDIRGLAVMGLFDVLKKLPQFFQLQELILKKIRAEKPACLILVDFSGFNLRLAKAVNKEIPVIYYVSPQVWASRPGRLKTIKKYISKMIVLFKFEQEFYRKHGIAADLVDHPLLDMVKPAKDKITLLKEFNLDRAKKTITLLPGSRKSEIENILPIMLETYGIIAEKNPDLQLVIAKAPGADLNIYNRITKNYQLDLKIVDGRTYDCLELADFALVCSGTATLETAIMQKPFCIVYKMGLLNYLLYRPQVKVPYIGMANIVAGRKIIPEFIQFQAIQKKIAAAALEILQNPDKLEEMRNALREVKSSLGEPGASHRAARIILGTVSRDCPSP